MKITLQLWKIGFTLQVLHTAPDVDGTLYLFTKTWAGKRSVGLSWGISSYELERAGKSTAHCWISGKNGVLWSRG